MTLRSLALCLALTLTPALSCAARPSVAAVDEALASAASDRAAAAARLEAALDGASGEEAAWIALNAGEQLRLLGDDRAAKKHFKDVSKSETAHARAGDLGLALLDGMENLGDEALAELRGISEKVALETQNADRFLLLALAAGAEGNREQAATFTKKALRYAAADPDVDRRVRAKLESAVGGPPAGRNVASPTTVELLDAAVAAKDRAQVVALADTLKEGAEPGSDQEAIARYALRRLDAPLDPQRIAVLLPLSGKYTGVGAQIKHAVELGFRAGGGKRRLSFIDTGADEASAVAALERAVLQDGAIAVVGPLRSEVAPQVAQAANALRVPLIGLHQDGTAADDRPWVLDGLATPEAQVEALVEYVMGSLGMKAFAIFAPDNPYGQSAADAFAAEVERRGGKISVREHYDVEATDLIPYAKKLGRKDYEARKREFWDIKRAISDMGGDPSKAVLPPIIDFEAIFLPDNRRRVPVAAAGLAYEEFPVGEFRIDKNGPTYPLLGLSGWNNPELVTTGGPYVRSSIFVDAWIDGDPAVRAFVESYQADTEREPNTLEAQAWTVGRVLAAATRAETPTRDALRQALLTVTLDAPTATGATGVDAEHRRIDHRVKVLTLDKDGIKPIIEEEPEAGDTDAPAPDGTGG